MAKGNEPHWLIVMLLSALLALILVWLGLEDWRVPWARPDAAPSPQAAATGLVAGTSPSALPSRSAPPSARSTVAPTAEPPAPTVSLPATAAASGEERISVAPVHVDLTGDGGVDVTWEVSHAQGLYHYDVDVTAVRPIEYTYSVPRYGGDKEVQQRIYPADYLDKALAEEGDPRQVSDGQVWYVCVQGMKKTPLNEPIDPYIIPGTRACSEDFTLP